MKIPFTWLTIFLAVSICRLEGFAMIATSGLLASASSQLLTSVISNSLGSFL